MANYRHGATYGSLAYDLDALAREKQLDEAGKLPQKKVRPAQPEVQISALEEQHIALLTEYERTFDLATVKAAAEAAGMSKPSSGQIQYIDLSGADSVEVYAAGGAAALNGFTEKAESLWAYVLEYFR